MRDHFARVHDYLHMRLRLPIDSPEVSNPWASGSPAGQLMQALGVQPCGIPQLREWLHACFVEDTMIPSRTHQSLLWLFSNDPELAVELGCRVAGRPPPTDMRAVARHGSLQRSNLDEAEEPEDEDRVVLTDLLLTVHRADPETGFIDPVAARAVWVVEVQLGRDESRVQAWSAYYAAAAERYGLGPEDVDILVICPFEAVRNWIRTTLSPQMRRMPYIVEPEHVPVIEDDEEARARPEASVLSVVFHGGQFGAYKVVAAGIYAIGGIESKTVHNRYYDLILDSVHPETKLSLDASGKPVQVDIAFAWEKQGLTWGWHADRFKRQGHREGRREGRKFGRQEGRKLGYDEGRKLGLMQGRERGRQEGIERGLERGLEQGLEKGLERGFQEGQREARMEGIAAQLRARKTDLLLVCELLGFEVSDEQREEIHGCTQLEQLDQWFEALRGASCLEDVLQTVH